MENNKTILKGGKTIMKKIIAGLFAVVLVAGVARADVGAPAPTAKDLEKVVEEVNYVETAKSGITLSGYVDVGYVYNFSSAPAGNVVRGGSEQITGGDFNTNAVKLVLEKALTDANEFQAGFRVDLIFGEDVRTVGNGIGGVGGAGTGTIADADSFFLEQAYVTFRVPYGNGIDLKVGKFVTWLGYEVIERPANLNITFGNIFFNAVPFFHTGISAEYAFNDIVDAGIAITNGVNNDTTAVTGAGGEDGYGIMAKINFTNPGGNANWYHAIYYGFGNDGVSGPDFGGTTFVYDTWGNWAPKAFDDKLLLGFNFNIGFNDTDISAATANTGNDWWAAALFAKYQFTDIFSLAGRAEYLTGDGTNSFIAGSGGAGSSDVWSWTLTAGFDLLENFLIRAEYRFDISSDFGAAVDDVYHTVAMQAVYTF
ncbi:MAG: outer membrane beta-barrel protein [Verrucomicrobiota bacterium]